MLRACKWLCEWVKVLKESSGAAVTFSLLLCAVVFCYGLTTSAGRCCAPQHPAPHTSLFLVWHLGVSGVHCHTHCVSLGASWKAFTPSPTGSVECLNHCLCLAYRQPCWEQGLCMETPWGMCFLGQIAYPLTVWWCSLLCWDSLLVALCGEILFAAKLFLAAAFFPYDWLWVFEEIWLGIVVFEDRIEGANFLSVLFLCVFCCK